MSRKSFGSSTETMAVITFTPLTSLISSCSPALSPPLVFAFCLGFHGALPADPANLFFLSGMIPSDSRWGLIHHGMGDLALLAAAAGLGATFVRVGYEDGVMLAPGRVARHNAELVERLAGILQGMGLGIATPAEARAMLGMNRTQP